MLLLNKKIVLEMEILKSHQISSAIETYNSPAALVTDPMVAAHEAWDYLVQRQVVAPAEEVHGMKVCRLLEEACKRK